MEDLGAASAGEAHPQCVSRSKEKRRGRNLRHANPEAAAATIPNATGCCQSIHRNINHFRRDATFCASFEKLPKCCPCGLRPQFKMRAQKKAAGGNPGFASHKLELEKPFRAGASSEQDCFAAVAAIETAMNCSHRYCSAGWNWSPRRSEPRCPASCCCYYCIGCFAAGSNWVGWLSRCSRGYWCWKAWRHPLIRTGLRSSYSSRSTCSSNANSSHNWCHWPIGCWRERPCWCRGPWSIQRKPP